MVKTNDLKNHKADVSLSKTEIQSFFNITRKNINDYLQAIISNDRYRTQKGTSSLVLDNRSRLMDLYESVMTQDAHVKALIVNLESQLLGQRYGLGTEDVDGKFIKNQKLSKLIYGSQFIKIIRGILESNFYGYSLLELGKIDKETGKLKEVKQVERRNVYPTQNWVARQVNSYPGWDITKWPYADNYCLIKTDDLGLLVNVLPLALAKKQSIANYMTFSGVFGMPIIHGKVIDSDTTAKQAFANAISAATNNRIIVSDLDTELTIHSVNVSNSERVFTGLVELSDNSISNLLVGSISMGGKESSYSGSVSANQDMLRERVAVYREYIENAINEEILPRLIKMGMLPDEEGLVFRYGKSIEMGDADKIKLFTELLKNKYVPNSEIEREFGVVVEDIKPEDKPPTTTPKPTPSKVNASVNFLQEMQN